MNKKSIGILYFCLVLYLTFSCLYACTSDDEFNNASDFELGTNASSSMIITEPSPIDTKFTDQITFNHYFNVGDDSILLSIKYIIKADNNLNNFDYYSVSWNCSIPMGYNIQSLEKHRTLNVTKLSNNIIATSTFRTVRHYGSNGYEIVDSHDDILHLTSNSFH